MTGVLIQKSFEDTKIESRHTKHRVTWRQEVEGCIYKPRNIKDCWQLPEARRKA